MGSETATVVSALAFSGVTKKIVSLAPIQTVHQILFCNLSHQLLGRGEAPRCFRAASPPRGAVPLPLYDNFFIHVNTPFIIEVSTTLLLKSVS
jgi:hypothetical protein